LRRLLLVGGRVPRYVPYGDRDPQRRIRVTLDGLDPPIDVTRNHVIVGLRPLTVAIARPPAAPAEMLERRSLRLTFSPESDGDTVLGAVRLRPTAVITVDRTAFHLFHASGYRNACMPVPARMIFATHNGWADWKRRKKRNFRMERPDLNAFQVLYICPRPVVLVTMVHAPASNLFPMDLIGPTASPYFLMALRNTSPSIALIRESRRLALADVPLEYTRIAIQLGEHHEKERIDWSALPFATEPSAGHGFPVLRDALRVRDVLVREVHVVGSHTLFVTEVVHEERRRDGLQMFFIAGPYYRYLALRGVALTRPGA
jgi:flavin reductase (DIM6/NTAB) family NADH-FMN oxidoreductase RutF